jgi:hypothetical protein
MTKPDTTQHLQAVVIGFPEDDFIRLVTSLLRKAL